MSFPILDLTSDHPLIQEIYLLGVQHQPNEVCGVILPSPFRGSQVVMIPNESSTPTEHFLTSGKAIAAHLHEWLLNASSSDLMNIIFWHTHPRGNIGPSKGDLVNRVFGMYYLVVSLTDDGACPVIY